MRELAIDLRRVRDEGTGATAGAGAHEVGGSAASEWLGRRRALLMAAALTGLGLAAAADGWPAGPQRRRGRLAADVRLAPLTREAGYNGEPTVSPDDSAIAYVTDRFGTTRS